MKIKTTPAAEPSAAEAEQLVAERSKELAAIRADIAAAEASLHRLADSDDDDAFETASLAIERMRRGELRATRRLEGANAALTAAKAREAEERRQALFEAGVKAAAEVERLADEYGRRATAVAETLLEIAKYAETIRVADDNRPDDALWLSDLYALRIHESVVLPAAPRGSDDIWCRGPVEPRKPIVGNILVDGIYQQFDASNPGHLAALTEKPAPSIVNAHQPSRQSTHKHEKILTDGSRKVSLPPVEWPPRPESEAAR